MTVKTDVPRLLGFSRRMSEASLRGSWYGIDLGAIRHNYRELRSHLPSRVKVYACLKRNGYGCGAASVAAALASEGVHAFAVASLLDAIAIRNEGIKRPILLYPGALPDIAPAVEALDLTVTVSSMEELNLWRGAMRKIHAFIKVDLGFFRAGATPLEAARLTAFATACPNVNVEGIYAHMSELPLAAPSDADDQFLRMRAVLAQLENQGIRPPIAMMSSTEGVIEHPHMDLDAVDPGALLVGLPETNVQRRQMRLRPALKTIGSHLVAVKRLDASLGRVPAGLGFHDGMVLGVIGIGWGDGFPRKVPRGATALVRGQRVPILPPAHLEHMRVDLTDVPGARFGDPVILLGNEGDHEITLNEIASLWGTDAVGLYGSLRDHMPRIYT